MWLTDMGMVMRVSTKELEMVHTTRPDLSPAPGQHQQHAMAAPAAAAAAAGTAEKADSSG
jgi:hypothetical protein